MRRKVSHLSSEVQRIPRRPPATRAVVPLREGITAGGCCNVPFWTYNNGTTNSVIVTSIPRETYQVAKITIARRDFLKDRQGRTFADVLNDPEQPIDEVLAFFSDAGRQRRMEESELHHDRAPLAGVVRELEAQPTIHEFLSGVHAGETKRLRQAIGVVVRMIMERRGWKKSGKKGSLGVRAASMADLPAHNTGGLALWFVRAERYKPTEGIPYRPVAERCQELEAAQPGQLTSKR